MATLTLLENGISSGMATAEDFWNGSIGLQDVRQLRRGSQPTTFQSNRRSSVTPRQPRHAHRRDSVTIDGSSRDSLSRDQLLQRYRRDSLTSQPPGSLARELTAGLRHDARDSSWIARYQKSDHHTDRIANTNLEYEKSIGNNLAGQSRVIPR